MDADNSVKALSFDGSGDTVTFTEQSFALEFTISFWVIFDDVTLDYKTVISGSASTGTNDIIMKDTNGQLQIRIAGEYAAGAQTLASNTWYHIAYTRDSDNLVTGYVNGSATNTHTESGTFNVSTIGGSAVHKQTSFAMYNKCKTASEIVSIYNDGIDGDESSNSDLTLYYKLDNASTVTDLSSTGTNGSVSNATLVENAIALDSTSNNNEGTLL